MKILGPFPVASIECLKLFEELILNTEVIDFDKDNCTRYLGNKDRHTLANAKFAYFEYRKEKGKYTYWVNFEREFNKLSFSHKMDLESFKITPSESLWSKIHPIFQFIFLLIPIILIFVGLLRLFTPRSKTKKAQKLVSPKAVKPIGKSSRKK